jgi:hypothetical protein
MTYQYCFALLCQERRCARAWHTLDIWQAAVRVEAVMPHTLRPVPPALVPVTSPPYRSAWVHDMRGKHRTTSAMPQGQCQGRCLDVLRQGITTAAGEQCKRDTPLRLYRRTGSCLCPQQSCGVSPSVCKKLMGRGCGLTAARVYLLEGRAGGSVANFGVETIWDVLTWSVRVTRRRERRTVRPQ